MHNLLYKCVEHLIKKVMKLNFFRLLYRTELELVASKATMEFIENEIKELEILRSTKQAQLDALYGKYRQIQDFEKLWYVV